MMPPMDIEKLIADQGGPSALARKLGYSRQRVGNWKKARKVGLESVWDVSRVTGISVKTLRPDVFVRPSP